VDAASAEQLRRRDLERIKNAGTGSRKPVPAGGTLVAAIGRCSQ